MLEEHLREGGLHPESAQPRRISVDVEDDRYRTGGIEVVDLSAGQPCTSSPVAIYPPRSGPGRRGCCCGRWGGVQAMDWSPAPSTAAIHRQRPRSPPVRRAVRPSRPRSQSAESRACSRAVNGTGSFLFGHVVAPSGKCTGRAPAWCASRIKRRICLPAVSQRRGRRRGSPRRTVTCRGSFQAAHEARFPALILLARRTDVAKSSGVGLAGLGCAGSYPALEIPVRCHLAFRGLDHGSHNDPRHFPEPNGPDSDPRQKPLSSTEDRAGDGRERFGVGRTAGISSDRLFILAAGDHSGGPLKSSHYQARARAMACRASPTPAPTTVPLMRMN